MKLSVVSDEADQGQSVELSPSVIKILDGALDAIAARGVKKLSMSDIIDASGVSRGTLYRYFSNKDEVLAAVSEFVCTGFEKGIRESAEGITDPMEIFRSVMRFYARYTNENTPDRIFEVEPLFHLNFFRSRFPRYKQAVEEALESAFTYLETVMGESINREKFAETLVRLQLSTLLVPGDAEWLKLWDDAPEAIENWALKLARQHECARR